MQKARLDLWVPNTVKARLEALARQESTTLSDIVRRALALYELATTHVRDGAVIQIRYGDVVKELVL